MAATGDPRHLTQIQAQLPNVRAHIDAARESTWPVLRHALEPVATQPTSPLASLPLAASAAVGGTAAAAVPLAAAWEIFNLGARILDDLCDRDRADQVWHQLGPPRTFNLCGALLAHALDVLASASWPHNRRGKVLREVTAGAVRLAEGQDRDLLGADTTIEAYWETIDKKNGTSFGMICAAGAWCGTDDTDRVEACRSFGRHLGIALQLLDDMEGVWYESGGGDVGQGRVSLPVLWALATPHPHREEVRQLVETDMAATHADSLRALLDASGAREFTIRCALAERDLALQPLVRLPVGEGRTALEAYATTVFADVAALLTQ